LGLHRAEIGDLAVRTVFVVDAPLLAIPLPGQRRE
jgi:hypothetical protein